jgi:hypothetical protein
MVARLQALYLVRGRNTYWYTFSAKLNLFHRPLPGDGLVPFLIRWHTPLTSALHPSTSSPEGCSLVSLSAVHPRPDTVSVSLQQLGGIEQVHATQVIQGATARLECVLETPKGRVTVR